MEDNATLALDATYNTNVENFCVWLFGILLKNSSFQPIKDARKKDPKYVMADGAQSISKAVLEVYPTSIRLMCWFHVAQNVKK